MQKTHYDKACVRSAASPAVLWMHFEFSSCIHLTPVPVWHQPSSSVLSRSRFIKFVSLSPGSYQITLMIWNQPSCVKQLLNTSCCWCNALQMPHQSQSVRVPKRRLTTYVKNPRGVYCTTWMIRQLLKQVDAWRISHLHCMFPTSPPHSSSCRMDSYW